MTNHEHERAIDLITRRGVEDIAAPDAGLAGVAPGAVLRVCGVRQGLVESTGQLAAVGGGHRQPGAGGDHAGTGYTRAQRNCVSIRPRLC